MFFCFHIDLIFDDFYHVTHYQSMQHWTFAISGFYQILKSQHFVS